MKILRQSIKSKIQNYIYRIILEITKEAKKNFLKENTKNENSNYVF